MGWPNLVPDCLCKTPITVTVYQADFDEDGAPVPDIVIDGMCNYQDAAHRVLTPEEQLITITGVALFNGDLAPGLPVITDGEAVVYGVAHKIYKGTKARNPDGTVNYTKLELM